jgi:two-component system CheB/CheR fusion protein
MADEDALKGQDQELVREVDTESQESADVKPSEAPLAIVGIGASAGGLEALEQFFLNMPAENGMAFVVIQHQDPAQPSLLPEILQRFTKMQVVSIDKDGLKAQPNTVYVKPPEYDLSILNGVFAIFEPSTKIGGRMSIDLFFRHLAEDQDGKAIGLILSGMGSDGTLGVRALKEHTGMVMAQEPSSAAFDSMPQNVISTGLVDYVATPEKLPQMLVDYIQATSQLQVRIPVTHASETAIAKIFVIIRARTGKDFSMYKQSTIMRRIERHMGLRQMIDLDDYVRFLQENPQEVEILAKEMLIGVTQFFRDPDAWNKFRDKALTKLVSSRSVGSTIRIWIVGCSTGEEAYTMAIILTEALEALGRSGDIRYQIFATDIESESIEAARTGLYPQNIEADVSTNRLERFFVKEDRQYRIIKHLRDNIVFALQNVIRDPPFTHLDIIICRNLLIYLTPDLQKKLITLFHFALESNGILFLGEAETVGGRDDLFVAIDRSWKIFERKYAPASEEVLHELPMAFETPEFSRIVGKLSESREPSVIAIAQGKLLEQYAPPAIVVTKDGDILYVHGRTSKYLELSPGKANLNIISMAREGLRYTLISALRDAVGKRQEIVEKNVFIQTDDGGSKRLKLTIRPIHKHGETPDLFLVTFQDQPEIARPKPSEHPQESRPEIKFLELEKELKDTKLELQGLLQEKQASQEELTSMNEELQSANEELQSTNEELTSSKEELQSINEEIQTMNTELQAKIAALTQSNDDMRNLLQSANIPMAFLDGDLKIRRYTDAIKPIMNLRENDIGRSVSDLKLNLPGFDFAKDANIVLDTLQFREMQIETDDGKWYQIRLMPYRTSDNKINGVTATFIDITKIKTLEISLRDAKNFAENIVDTVREPLIVLNSDLKVISASRSFYSTFKATPDETIDKLLYNLGDNQWDIPQLRQLLEDILPKNISFDSFEVKHEFPKIGMRTMILNARKITSETDHDLILLAIEDITDRSS